MTPLKGCKERFAAKATSHLLRAARVTTHRERSPMHCHPSTLLCAIAAVACLSAAAAEVYTEEQIKGMSSAELRRLLRQAGEKCNSCIEKSDFIEVALPLAGKEITTDVEGDEKKEAAKSSDKGKTAARKEDSQPESKHTHDHHGHEHQGHHHNDSHDDHSNSTIPENLFDMSFEGLEDDGDAQQMILNILKKLNGAVNENLKQGAGKVEAKESSARQAEGRKAGDARAGEESRDEAKGKKSGEEASPLTQYLMDGARAIQNKAMRLFMENFLQCRNAGMDLILRYGVPGLRQVIEKASKFTHGSLKDAFDVALQSLDQLSERPKASTKKREKEEL